jgi:pilin isopeptide linkage protein
VVKVTEIQVDDDGFTVKGDEVTQEVRMLGATETYAQFINIYSPKPVEPVTVNVSGVKILEGREWAEGDTFQFVLEQEQGDDNWVKVADRTITYDAANTGFNSFTFSDLIQSMTFDKVGIYAFRMTEAEGTLENVTYDKTVNYFSIHVTDVDMDGKLEIGKVTGKQNCAITQDAITGVYDVLVTFNNTFIPPVIPDPDPITVSLFVQKTVKNTTSKTIGPEGFNFLVEQTGSTQLWTITSDADGKAQLDLTYTHEDLGKTYTYTVSEINDGREGVLYSEQTYELTVTITLDEENNILVPKLTNGGESVNKWETAFENTYTHKEPLTPPTGDETPLLMWSILMAASGIAIVVLVVTGRKKKWS